MENRKERSAPCFGFGVIALLMLVMLLSGAAGRDVLPGIIIFAIAFVGLIALGIYFRKLDKEGNEEMDKRKEEERIAAKEALDKVIAEYESSVKDLESQYGEVTKKISLKEHSILDDIIAFSDTKKIWICGIVYSFRDVISCTFSDNPTVKKGKVEYKTKTSTGNMLGRAVVGGVLMGGVGAAIGGATAKKNTVGVLQDDIIIHDYTVIINVNDIANPIVRIGCGERGSIVNEIVGLMNVIIRQK
ncbi:MAG: hypothetical protein LUC88_10475 [Prevotella sp.]|nr:hypothetical protein [Prevotella sp.]